MQNTDRDFSKGLKIRRYACASQSRVTSIPRRCVASPRPRTSNTAPSNSFTAAMSSRSNLAISTTKTSLHVSRPSTRSFYKERRIGLQCTITKSLELRLEACVPRPRRLSQPIEPLLGGGRPSPASPLRTPSRGVCRSSPPTLHS
jgi:hypothetical protein